MRLPPGWIDPTSGAEIRSASRFRSMPPIPGWPFIHGGLVIVSISIIAFVGIAVIVHVAGNGAASLSATAVGHSAHTTLSIAAFLLPAMAFVVYPTAWNITRLAAKSRRSSTDPGRARVRSIRNSVTGSAVAMMIAWTAVGGVVYSAYQVDVPMFIAAIAVPIIPLGIFTAVMTFITLMLTTPTPQRAPGVFIASAACCALVTFGLIFGSA